MKTYLLLLSLIFIQHNAQAQQEINFKTIDVIKSEDSNPNSLVSLKDKAYFFANSGKNYSDYYLWNLDKNSKKIEQSNFTVKGNYNKVSFIGNLDETIYYVDENSYDNKKLYLLSETNGEQNVLSNFTEFNILQKQPSFLIISYVQNKIHHIARLTSTGIEELINTNDDSLKNKVIDNHTIYFVSDLKVIKFDINTKIKEEIIIPAGSEFEQSYYTISQNLFNGNIYYTSLNKTTWQRKIIKFNIASEEFETLNLTASNINNFYSTTNFAVFTANNINYKIDKNNNIAEYKLIDGYTIRQGKVVEDRLFLELLSMNTFSMKLAEVTNSELVLHDYEMDLSIVNFDNNQFFTFYDNRLTSYNVETKNTKILNDNLAVHDILGFDETKIYLQASKPETGKELYAYNKITNETEFYGDINAKPNTSPKSFYNVGNKVFYEGNYKGYNHLYVSDGTLQGTKVIKPENSNIVGGGLRGLEFNGKFLFVGVRNGSGQELWVTDGTDEGTYEIEINPTTGDNNGFGSFIAKTPTKVYFKGYVPNKGFEIWVTDGTIQGTRMVKDLALGSASPNLSIPLNVTVGEKLYFIKVESANHNSRSDLWVTDGTLNGTTKIKELTEFWNWDSHYNIKIFDADETYLYYSKYYVAPYGEEKLSGDYIHRLNLVTLLEERLYKYSNNVNVNKENFYFSEYIDNRNNFVSYNKKTNEKKMILNNVSYDFGYITTCGNYSIIADTDFSGHVGKSYFYNHLNGKVERIFKNDFASTSKKNIACVNDNILVNYTDYSENDNKKIVSIKNDKIIEYSLSLDNSTNIHTYLSGEMIYNSKLKKLFINPDNELAVADFYLEDLNTEDLNVNNNLKSLQLYPNPADNIVNIKSLSNIQTLTVIDFTGRVLKEQKNINQKDVKLNISGIPKGIYIIHVKTEQESVSKKLIVK